jgi:hypothetical protein
LVIPDRDARGEELQTAGIRRSFLHLRDLVPQVHKDSERDQPDEERRDDALDAPPARIGIGQFNVR